MIQTLKKNDREALYYFSLKFDDGRILRLNSLGANLTNITDNGWHLNFSGSSNISETGSAIADGSEYDGTENFQFNLKTETPQKVVNL